MSMKAEDVDACEACRDGDHGNCSDPDGCGCEFMEDERHSGDTIQVLRTQLAEAIIEAEALKDDRDKWKGRAHAFVNHIETLQRKADKADKRLKKLEKERSELRKGIYSQMSLNCPACGAAGKGSDLKVDDKKDFAYLSCRNCKEEICIPPRMLLGKIGETEKELSSCKGVLESFAGASDLGRIFPFLQHEARRVLKLYPYNGHKPGCLMFQAEGVLKKHATYCTCPQDPPSKETP